MVKLDRIAKKRWNEARSAGAGAQKYVQQAAATQSGLKIHVRADVLDDETMARRHRCKDEHALPCLNRPRRFERDASGVVDISGSFEFRMGDVAPGKRLGASAWFDLQPIAPPVAIVAGDA